MKKLVLLLTLMAAVTFAGAAFGNSLSVTSAAAMGGVAQNNCSGDGLPGPCGLQVFHDNTSLSYVEDRTPAAETIYRATFLFNPNNISPGSNLRQRIFRAIGPNPRPGLGACSPTASLNPAFELWLFLPGGSGQNYVLQMYGLGNQCGPRATGQFLIAPDQPVRVCMEYESGNSNTGRIRLAVVTPADPCPTSGAAYSEAILNNGFTNVNRVLMGIPTLNNFGAGESGDLYFDEFESFRTLAP